MSIGLIIISLSAFFASLISFFSGFGLGTILLPIFAIWFPVEQAVGLTAIVHLLNNFFKLLLTGKHINWKVLLRFGSAGILAAYIGAKLLLTLTQFSQIHSYTINNHIYTITVEKLSIALLIICFVIIENITFFKNMQIDEKYLPLGGLLSGFFGGLSGHQGALRSMFLMKTQMTKEEFIATGTTIGCLIDIVRISVYSNNYFYYTEDTVWTSVLSAAICALLGALIGNKLLKNLKYETVKNIISLSLIGFAACMGLGII